MPHLTKKQPKKQNSKPAKTGNFFANVKAFLVDSWPIIFLIAAISLLCFLNYDQGTFLSGWDNLHPEFNPNLYLKRSIFAVWQEYQATGLLGGMAHSADLPRVLFIYLLNLLHFPVNLVRYLTTFLTLYLGPIFCYLIFQRLLSLTKHSQKTIQISAFLGSLFYLLNLSTLQTFFIPFETFTWFYGFFPIVIYYLINYFNKPKLSSFLRLFFVSFLTSTAFYVETMFVVFILCLMPFFLQNLIQTKKYFQNTTHSLISTLAIITPHIYWLLPVIFFVFQNSQVTTQNHINSISSIETFYRNLEFANLPSFFNFKSYLFKYLDLGPNTKYELLLTPWINHLNSPFIIVIGIIFTLLVLLGLYYSLKTKIKYHTSFLTILFICAFFLLGGGLIINNTLPLIGELFRSPYTKFSLPLAFSFSYFFTIGIIFTLDIFAFLDTRLTYNFTLFTLTLLLFTYMSPAFSGNFLNKNMRVAIPNQYFELFKYLNNQPTDNRIANFPQYTFWGWNYYSWGYRGSGFSWYGIKQPILDRAFDVWEKTSEDYYQEVSTALYSQNKELFNQVIDKYNVGYLLVDKSIIGPEKNVDLGLNYLQNFIDQSNQYKLEKTFGDNLYLYKNLKHKSQDFLSLTSPSDQPVIPSLTLNPSPILSFSQRPNQNWYEKAGFINTNLTLNSTSSSLFIPSITDLENSLPYNIEYKKNQNSLSLKLTPILPYFFLDDKQIDFNSTSYIFNLPISNNLNKVILNLNSNYLSFDLPYETPTTTSYAFLDQVYLPTNKDFPISIYQGIPTEQYPIINSFLNTKPQQCYTNKENRKIEMITAPRTLTLLGTDVVACLSAPLPPVNSNQLLALSFTYYSPTLTTANANVTNQNFGASNTSQPFEPSKTPKRGQVFIKASANNKQVNLLLEAEDSKTVQEITYKDIYLSSHETIYDNTLRLPKIPEQFVSLDGSTSAKLQISLPITKTNLDVTETPQSNSLFPESRNCDQFNNGQVAKVVKENGFLYQSQNAIQCDYLNLRHLPHSQNYLLGINVENQKGLPLATCLENYSTRRCDVYERLKSNNGQQYVLQTINNPQEPNGYTLHLFNQSFGNRRTQNLLKSISIHPFPLNFLQNISTSSVTPDNKITVIPGSVQESRNNTLVPDQVRYDDDIESTHPAEFLYTAVIARNISLHSVIPNSDPESIQINSNSLNLYQTKSSYWQAYILPKEYRNLNPWQLTLKILLNYKNLPKLESIDNGQWFNQFLLNKQSTMKNEQYIAIIYLPQYLEFFGLTIIVLIPLISLPVLLYQKLKS